MLLGVAAVVVAFDQVTKTWALRHLVLGQPRHVFGPLSWLRTFNTGAAFGIGGAVTPVVVAVVAVLVAGLLLFGRRASR
ncbi:MAG: signal peptidase II, partial [Acidimicrobiales bacterium]